MLLVLRLLSIAVFFSSSMSWGFTVSSDQNYFIVDDQNYQFIYSDEARPFIKALISQNRELTKKYSTEFDWTLDEKATLILASSQNQIANGFATLFPNLKTVFYGGGVELIDDFSNVSWSRVLLLHETAHLYQLSPKHDYSALLHKVFGNTSPNIAPPFTYMMAPNIFLPTFVLEGNATFNEGRFENGGRLYSGEYRALFLNLLKTNKVTSKRLINDHLDWPYGQEKYLIGGYFQLYLAETFGVEKTNQFFVNNAKYFFIPFQLNKSFKDTFGIGYEEALKGFRERFASYAAEIQTTPTRHFAQSISHRPFGRNPSNGAVSFFAFNGKNAPELYEVLPTKSAPQVSKKKINIPINKPLYINNMLYTASSETVKHNKILFGLFKKNYTINEHSLGQYVFDIHKNKKVYAQVSESFVEPQVYESDINNQNKRLLGAIHSSAQYSSKGDLYFFRQKKSERVLFKNSEEVFSFKGYYGKVADITENGDIYFIAATERGSSLFRFSNQKVERLLNSDTVIDAKILSTDQFVIAELTDKGYEYKLTDKIESRLEGPFYYGYFYEKSEADKTLNLSEKQASQPLPALATDSPLPETSVESLVEKPYSYFKNMQFNGADPLYLGYSNYGPLIGLGFRFSDPLEYHSLSFNYAHLEGATNDAYLYYLNRKNRLNWVFAAGFDQSAIFDRDSADENAKVIARYETWLGALGLLYPHFVKPQISGTASIVYNYEYDDTKDSVSLDREQTVLTSYELERQRRYGLAFSSTASEKLVLAHEALGDIPKWQGDRIKYAAKIDIQRDLIHETYLNIGYHAVQSDGPQADIEIDQQSTSSLSSPLEKPTELTRFSDDTTKEYREAHRFSTGLQQAINSGFYFTKFPLSLRRFAPFVKYQEFYGRTAKKASNETLFHEWAYGSDFEILLLHRFPLRFSIYGVEMNKKEGTAITSLLTFKNNF